MTKRTKRALVSSALALLLCFTMLLGTTYAWFTDSVVTTKNKIVAGNLDIELYSAFQPEDGVLDDADWNMVDSDSNIFMENTLWEPGHLEVAYLKVANAGTLALEWDLAINIFNEVEGTNVYNNPFKLSGFLKAELVELADATAYADRDIAKTVLDNVGYGLTEYTNGGVLLAGEEKYYALIVYMPEEVENEANYLKDTAVPTIDMGITLLATQTPYENDSFGPDYDEDAVYNATKVATVDELKAAIAEGGTIVLTEDMAVSGTTKSIEITEDTTIYLNGNTIDAKVVNNRLFTVKGSDVDFVIDAMGTENPFGSRTYGIVVVDSDAENVNVTINGGTYKGVTEEGSFVRVRDGAKDVTVTLNNVTYTDTNAVTDGYLNSWVSYVDTNEGDGVKLVVNGGTYTAACGFNLYGVDATFNEVTLNVEGAGMELAGAGEYVLNNCNITLDPGEYVYSVQGTGVAASYGATVYVNGGKITVTGDESDALAAYPSGGTVIATGVEIDAAKVATVYAPYAGKTTSVIVDGVAQ
ncbi:MAG: hypothetical protein IJF42_06220 [Clostridia bacterium]|nr:hypothetical protein [Clostridia bacterium]